MKKNCSSSSRSATQLATSLEQELRSKTADMAAFERQLDGISRSNLAITRNLEAAEAENRRLKVRQQGRRSEARRSEARRGEARRCELLVLHN